MASAFSHIAIPALIYACCKCRKINTKVMLLGAFCSVVPDADILAFHFAIPYESPWGHRGFTHSIAFAAFLALLVSPLHRHVNSTPIIVFCLSFLSCISHGVLDAMTNGGLGIAFFWPLSPERYFFPLRPIQVSPIGVSSFFSEWGIRVLVSESIWIILPAITVGMLGVFVRTYRAGKALKT